MKSEHVLERDDFIRSSSVVSLFFLNTRVNKQNINRPVFLVVVVVVPHHVMTE